MTQRMGTSEKPGPAAPFGPGAFLLALWLLAFVSPYQLQSAGTNGAPSDVLVFEAESAVDLTGIFQFFHEDGISGRAGIQVREGCGADFDDSQLARLHAKFPDVGIAGTPARARYLVPARISGDYVVWARTYWLWECSNSFWVGDPGVSGNVLTDKQYYRWHWVRSVHPVHLNGGVNELVISNREDGIKIDQFCLVPMSGYRPHGMLTVTVLPSPFGGSEAVRAYPTPGVALAFADAETSGTLWLRNVSGVSQAVSASCRSGDGLATSMSDVAIPIPPLTGLVAVPFSFRSTGRLPFSDDTLVFDVRDSGGNIATHELRVVHSPRWEAAGPFRNGMLSAPLLPKWESVPGDSSPPPGNLDQLAWQAVTGPGVFTGSGRIDLKRVFPRFNRWCWCYVRAQVAWPRDEMLPMELRSDDQALVWLNGGLVCAQNVVGPGERYFTRFGLPMKRGPNTILLAVNQLKAFWEVSLVRAFETIVSE